MLWLIGMAASSAAMALPVPQSHAIGQQLQPELNKGGSAAVKVRVVVDPSGAPVRCSVRFKNGPARNGDTLCALIRAQTRFSPALNVQGIPTFGVTYVWSRWDRGTWAGDEQPSWDPVDVALTTNQVPRGYPEGAIFQLIVFTSHVGSISDCEATDTRLNRHVVDLLCREARAVWITPAKDQNGRAVPSVQQFMVRLTSGKRLEQVMKKMRSR